MNDQQFLANQRSLSASPRNVVLVNRADHHRLLELAQSVQPDVSSVDQLFDRGLSKKHLEALKLGANGNPRFETIEQIETYLAAGGRLDAIGGIGLKTHDAIVEQIAAIRSK